MSDNPRASFNRRMTTVVILLIVLAIYSYPYLATTRTLQSRQVPFSFAADLSLYLNLGQLGSSRLQPAVNPYYGSPMQLGLFGYLTFDLAFRVFGWLQNIVGHNLWWTVLIWNWLWWAVIFAGALWFFRLALFEKASSVLWLGIGLLFFFNFGVLKSLLVAWLHLPSLDGFEALSLPYIRVFFPQIPVALLLLYLALQIRWLRSSKWYDWAGLWALQAVALAMFPYATLVMAGSTFVVLLGCFSPALPGVRLKAIIPYAVACAAIDCMFLLHRMTRGTQDSQLSFVRFRPSHLFDLTGGSMILLLLLGLLTLVLRPVGSRETKWTIVGLGSSTALLMLADVVAAPSLLMSSHGGYFLHCTVTLQITYLLSGLWMRLERFRPWMRPAFLTAIFLVTVNGALLAFGNYRSSLPQNREIRELAQAVGSVQIDERDLIIARADTVDDLCSWVPLLSRATVLFCRSAQYELSDSERRGFHRLRQAFYLYFTGKDTRWVDGVISDPAALTAQDRLAFAGEINPSDKETLLTGKREIAAELIPRLAEVEGRQGRARDFFSSYARVLLVDHATHPNFVKERLLEYLSIDSEHKLGDFVLLWCRPKPGHGELESPHGESSVQVLPIGRDPGVEAEPGPRREHQRG